MSYLGAVLFVAFSVGLLAVSGVGVITVGLLVTSVVFAVIALFDLPFASEFRRDGVVRRAALRHQYIDWERVTRLRRLRVGMLRTRRDGRGGRVGGSHQGPQIRAGRHDGECRRVRRADAKRIADPMQPQHVISEGQIESRARLADDFNLSQHLSQQGDLCCRANHANHWSSPVQAEAFTLTCARENHR